MNCFSLLDIYCLYLWQCGRLVMHLKIEFQIEVEVFLGGREMPLDLLRMMSGVQNKSPLPPHKEKFLYKTLIYTMTTKNNLQTEKFKKNL